MNNPSLLLPVAARMCSIGLVATSVVVRQSYDDLLDAKRCASFTVHMVLTRPVLRFRHRVASYVCAEAQGLAVICNDQTDLCLEELKFDLLRNANPSLRRSTQLSAGPIAATVGQNPPMQPSVNNDV
jgi:hypothetical protein